MLIENHLQEKECTRTEARLKAEVAERAKVEEQAAREKVTADAEAARLKAIQDAEN